MGASYDPYTPKCTPHPVLQAQGYTSTPLEQFMNGLLFYEQVTVFRWHRDPFLIVNNKQISSPTPRDEQKAAIWRVCSPDLNLSATCERRWWGEQQAEMGYVSHMHISEDQAWCDRQCLLKLIHFRKAKKGKGRGRGLISFGGNIPNGQNLMVIGQGPGKIADKSWNDFEPASSNRWLVQWFLHMTPYTFPLQSFHSRKISETHY